MKIKNIVITFILLILSTTLILFSLFSVDEFRQDKYSSELENSLDQVESLANVLSDKLKVTTIDSDVIQSIFIKKNYKSILLIDKKGKIIAGENQYISKNISEIFDESYLEKINSLPSASGVFDANDRNRTGYLNVISFVAGSDYFVLSLTNKSILNRIIYKILFKNIYLFFILIILSSIISYIMTVKLTYKIELIQSQMSDVSLGKLDIIPIKSSIQEIEKIGFSIKSMANQLKKLLIDEKEKSRLQYEAQAAFMVQKMLLLPSEAAFGELSLSAHYQPATECGGDWWYYFKKGDQLFVCIIDVTGHGIASALLTSSVRSAFHFYCEQNDVSTESICESLNKLIFNVVGGKLQMTCFCLSINLNNLEGRYTNASHEPVMIIPADISNVKSRKDLNYLMECHGSRIGEKLDSTYTFSEFKLLPKQKLFFYTDGLLDLEDKSGKVMNERTLVKVVLTAFKISESNLEVKNKVVREIANYTSGAHLKDDVSFVILG